jgi:hypothetical protein
MLDMNCQEFWNTMPELEGEMDWLAAAHLRECAGCSAAMGAQQRLAGGLHGLAGENARVQAPARVEARLVSAFRKHAGIAPGHSGIRRWKPVFAWGSGAILVAAAAALLLAVRERATDPARPGASGSAVASSVDWGARFAETADSASEFIPLPNAARLAPNDDVNLVRVEVPRSAMIAVGFVVPPDRAAERVQADVVLGSDGLARAVRFLDE